MIDLYIQQYNDVHNCETCGTSWSTIYFVSEKPFPEDDSDEVNNDVVDFGDGAACYDSRDGEWSDVIKYVNEKYSTNIPIGNPEYLNDTDIIDAFRDQGINLTLTYKSAYDDWDVEYWDED